MEAELLTVDTQVYVTLILFLDEKIFAVLTCDNSRSTGSGCVIREYFFPTHVLFLIEDGMWWAVEILLLYLLLRS
jgi:hypothetical protein